MKTIIIDIYVPMEMKGISITLDRIEFPLTF